MSYLTTEAERIKTGWILVSISSALTLSLIYWYIGNPQRFVTTRIGFDLELLTDLSVWIFTLLIVIGYSIYTVFAIPFVKAHLFTFSWLKLIGIWAAIVTGIVEEVLFRHVLMDYLFSIDLSSFAQIIISGLVFGLVHGAWGLLRGELKVILPVVLSTSVLGCLLAALYIFTDRSTFAPIVAHVLINIIIEPWLMLSAVSGKWKR
ncbi:CPBP family intramembrane glutamic endopeptidase [Alkalicoccobacillus murimartini]|uniref:Membrane protease YdiL (CAAX protease family) n=1 Tax=Alkalicoccobacillus murimartini TaxID=171685 RepID=A0ABT9YLC7_9BACI|nr:CPBP family intramembrane glutamic endopeptidase [Alkalicoccobacillus murimartini]MDQ0208686.1 membrane protease YdiL (CAAX protease family) [Alkalicoccobacillus murimartini]